MCSPTNVSSTPFLCCKSRFGKKSFGQFHLQLILLLSLSAATVGLHLHVTSRSPKTISGRASRFVLATAHLWVAAVCSGAASLPKPERGVALDLQIPRMDLPHLGLNHQRSNKKRNRCDTKNQKQKEQRLLPPPWRNFLISLLQKSLVNLLFSIHWLVNSVRSVNF